MSRHQVYAPNPAPRPLINSAKQEALITAQQGQKIRLNDQSISSIVNPIASQNLISASMIADSINTSGLELKKSAGKLAGLIKESSDISGDILSAAQKAHVKQDLLYLGTRVIPKLEQDDFQFSNTEKEHLNKLKDSLPQWTDPASAGLPDVLDFKDFSEHKVDAVLYLIQQGHLLILDQLPDFAVGDTLDLTTAVIAKGNPPPLQPPQTPPKAPAGPVAPTAPQKPPKPAAGIQTYEQQVKNYIPVIKDNDKVGAKDLSVAKLIQITDVQEQKDVVQYIHRINELISDFQALVPGARGNPAKRKTIIDEQKQLYAKIIALQR